MKAYHRASESKRDLCLRFLSGCCINLAEVQATSSLLKEV